MPHWQIFAPPKAFSEQDREQLSAAITSIYVTYLELPAFYVVVVFHDVPQNSMYVAGKARNDFVLVRIDHIARQPETAEMRALCMTAVEEALVPFVRDRGYGWEVYIDETPVELWRTQGLVPPAPYTDMEQLWAAENRAIPYELLAP